MEFILYRSASLYAQDSEVVLRILRGAVRFNEQHGVTGFLLARPGGFLQFVEAPEKSLRQCYERILASPLHGDMKTLASGAMRQRHFPNWSMGLVSDTDRVRARAEEWCGCATLDEAPASILVAAMAAEAHDRAASTG